MGEHLGVLHYQGMARIEAALKCGVLDQVRAAIEVALIGNTLAVTKFAYDEVDVILGVFEIGAKKVTQRDLATHQLTNQFELQKELLITRNRQDGRILDVLKVLQVLEITLTHVDRDSDVEGTATLESVNIDTGSGGG